MSVDERIPESERVPIKPKIKPFRQPTEEEWNDVMCYWLAECMRSDTPDVVLRWRGYNVQVKERDGKPWLRKLKR